MTIPRTVTVRLTPRASACCLPITRSEGRPRAGGAPGRPALVVSRPADISRCRPPPGVSMSGFRKFLMRGNLIDLAVAVVVGVAFNAIVQSLIKDLITPLIGAITGTNDGKPKDFAKYTVTLHGSQFLWGDFLNAVISFIVIAAVVYFLLVAPAAKLMTLTTRAKAATDR